MPENKNIIETPTDRSLVITRIFDAPPPLVYEMWTKKEHLDRWYAPLGFTIPESSGDVRPGGAWRNVMISPKGGRYSQHGVYREVVPNELLVFTHIWDEDDGTPEHEMVITVHFTDVEGKTKVTMEHATFPSVESREVHAGGWSECFDILEEQLAARQEKGNS